MRKHNHVTIYILLLITATIPVSLSASEGEGIKTDYYHVVDNKVDRQTFLGWSLFHDTCVACHGVGGSGSDRAPDLTVSLDRMSPVEFETKVLQRYLLSVPAMEAMSDDRTGLRQALIEEIRKQEARERSDTVMPKWEHNPVVKERIQNLYRYLKARADGVLGPDKPEILRE